MIPPVYVGKFDADDIGPAQTGTVRNKHDGPVPFAKDIVGVHGAYNTADFIFGISRDNTPVVILQLQERIITRDVMIAIIVDIPLKISIVAPPI